MIEENMPSRGEKKKAVFGNFFEETHFVLKKLKFSGAMCLYWKFCIDEIDAVLHEECYLPL